MMDDAGSGHPSSVVSADSLAAAEAVEASSEDLSALARAARLRALVDVHFDFVWRSLRRFGLTSADADDAAQRVFVVASRKLSEIESGRERSFLFGTAYRIVREVRRSRARRPEAPLRDELDVLDPAPNPEEFADRNRARRLLDDVLNDMPLEARSVFVLFELEEMSVPEIASMLELPIGTVGSRLRRGRELFHAAAMRLRARARFHGGT
jgi:RNA polymerase sigma-70 factor (ECF subfamily)